MIFNGGEFHIDVVADDDRHVDHYHTGHRMRAHRCKSKSVLTLMPSKLLDFI
jgi:hypothetical protein